MLRFIKISLIIFILFCISVISSFAYADQTAVEIISKSKDSVGQRLIYQIKEHIRISKSLRITTKDEPRLSLNIVTLDPNADINYANKNISTVYSMTLNICGTGIGDYFVNHWVGICGSKRVKEIAEDIIAEIDGYSQKVEESTEMGNKFKQFLQIKETAKDNLQNNINMLEKTVKDLEAKLNNEKAKSWWQKLIGK